MKPTLERASGPSITRPGHEVPTAEDRCPGILALHEAEDGWLARIRLPGGRISPSQLGAIGRLAQRGNGLVEVTRRANIQVRGLEQNSGPEAARVLAEVGLLPSLSHERVRNVLASPFGGRNRHATLLTDDVVKELDRCLCADPDLARLPRRFQFGVDDGSGLVVGQDLDVALVAGSSASRGEPVLGLWLGGVPTTAQLSRAEAVGAALEAARAFLAIRAETEGSAWRIRALRGGGGAVAERLGVGIRDSPGPAAQRESIPTAGFRTQRDGRVALTVLPPLGRVDARALAALAQAGAGSDVRLSPWRTLTIVDVAPAAHQDLAGVLADAGLMVAPSGFEGLSACAGLGACTKALIDVRAAAGRRASRRQSGAPMEHWSACERRCGQPRDAHVRVVGTGGAGVVLERDGIAERTSVEGALARLDGAGD